VAAFLLVLAGGLTFCLTRSDGENRALASAPVQIPEPPPVAPVPPASRPVKSPRPALPVVSEPQQANVTADDQPVPGPGESVPAKTAEPRAPAVVSAPPPPDKPAPPETPPPATAPPPETTPAKAAAPFTITLPTLPQMPGVPVVPLAPNKAVPAGRRAQTDTITFFTSTAKGKRFCIIADCSGSMAGAPILYLKQEMMKTLGSLKDDSQFYVIFFSSQAIPMPSASWVNGGKANVAKAGLWVQGIPAFGGTQPLQAFVKAFQLRPRPDVIFFMTDGIIPVTVPDQVALLNREEPHIPINTIMFAHPNILGTGRPAALAVLQPALNLAAGMLRRIADQSGGTYDLVKLGLP
jgi:hypothetical protein